MFKARLSLTLISCFAAGLTGIAVGGLLAACTPKPVEASAPGVVAPVVAPDAALNPNPDYTATFVASIENGDCRIYELRRKGFVSFTLITVCSYGIHKTVAIGKAN